MSNNDVSAHASPSPDAIPLSDQERFALAYHEAAHAVVAVATGYGSVNSLTIEGWFGYHGGANLMVLNPKHHETLAEFERGRDYLRATAIATAAGPVAGYRVSGTAGAWEESAEAVRDGYEPSTNGDYPLVAKMASLLGSSVDEMWAEADLYLQQPEVWDAIEVVAQALLARRERGEPGTLNAEGFHAVLGSRLSALKALAFTSPQEAYDAMLFW